MTDNRRFLDAIDIASPCSADWDAMEGDDRKRFCQECRLHVYDLSGMTAEETVALIRQSEGRVCARLFRRADGTVLTRDCPVGWAAVRRRARLAWARVAAVVAVSCAGLVGCIRKPAPDAGRRPPMQQPVQQHVMGEICPPQPGEVLMGKIKSPERAPERDGAKGR